MSREEVQKLLGGYATGTLTPAERQALCQAALEDQELFDALAKEQPLHDLLRDPAARARLLAVLDGERLPWTRRLAAWWLPAAGCLAVVGGAYIVWQAGRHSKPAMVAQVRQQEMRKEPAEVEKQSSVPGEEPQGKVAGDTNRSGLARESALSRTALQAPRAQRRSSPAPRVSTPDLRDAVASAYEKEQLPASVKAEPSAKADARGLFYGIVQSLGAQQAQAGQHQAAPGPAQREQDKAAPEQLARAAKTMPPVRMTETVTLAPSLGVRYTILRKTPDGSFAEANPEDLRAGDTVELQFVPNADGYLYITVAVGAARRQIASAAVTRFQPFTTPPLEPGDKDLTAVFSRVPQAGAVGGFVPQPQLEVPARNVTETVNRPERAVYVVNNAAGASSQQLTFPITLNYR
jgi:hypothetical protein